MKIPALLVLAWPAFLAADPDAANTPVPVAVCDFETEHGVDPALGPAIAEIVRSNLSVLPRLYSVNPKQSANFHAPKFEETPGPKLAAEIGGHLGAKALLTGRISKAGSSLTVAAKVVETDTGSSIGVAVNGSASEPMADSVSKLAIKIGAAVLHRTESEAALLWTPATLRGSDRVSGGASFLSLHETAYVSAVDGRPIARDRENWAKDQPLAPGRHGVAAAYYDGSKIAGCLLFFDATPGRSYELRSEDRSNDKALLWIADAESGRPVTVWVSPARSKKPQPTNYLEVEMGSRQDAIIGSSRGFEWVPGRANGLFGQ